MHPALRKGPLFYKTPPFSAFYKKNTFSTFLQKNPHFISYLRACIHLGRVSIYPCFILYIVSKRDQTNNIHLSGLST